MYSINDINNETIKTSIRHNLGHSKVKLPHQDTTDKPTTSDKTENKYLKGEVNRLPLGNEKPIPSSKTHDTNLAVVTVVASGLAWYMFR